MQPRTRGTARALLAAAFWCLCVAPGWARASGVAALPPRAPAELQTLATGAAEWVRTRIADAGAASQPGFALAAELPVVRAHVLAPAERLRALVAAGAERAWVLDLDSDRGRAVVQLAMLDLATSRTLAAGRAEGALGELGAALAQATDALLAQLGAHAPAAPPPS
ncbi:MAG: hypothetical protein DCC71_21440, partial [Proteobacteria bacterium]